MPGAIDNKTDSVAKALEEPITVTVVSGRSEISEILLKSAGIPKTVSSGAMSIESTSITIKDLQIMRRRALMGESQSDKVMDPSVLVVRRISGVGSVEKPTTKAAADNGVMTSESGGSLPTLDGEVPTDLIFATDRFLLQQVNEPDQEKVGPVYTFAKPKLYCSGRQPKIYTYGGMLVDNSIDGSAKAFWWSAYDEYLRGSKCVQNDALVELYFRDQVRFGYLLHTNMTEQSTTPSLTQFAFSMHVIKEISYAMWIPDVGLSIKDIVDRD